MKYKYIVLIILVSIIAITYKSFNKKNNYSFSRHFLKESIYTCNKFKKLSTITEHEFLYQTNNTLISINPGNKDSSRYRLKIYDLKKDSITSVINISLKYKGVEFIKNDTFFYIDKYKLFSKNMENNECCQVSPEYAVIYKASPISSSKYIYIGATKAGEKYETGFYSLENGISKIKKILGIDLYPTSIYRNDLIYSGNFIQNNKYIIYYCDKKSDIFIFNSKGEFLREIHTMENVPDPTISTFNDMYVYKRGYTHSTAIGIYEHNDYLYVLSYRCLLPCIVLDKYSIKTSEYIGSIKIKELKEANKNVKNVFGINDIIVLSLKSKFLTLKVQ